MPIDIIPLLIIAVGIVLGLAVMFVILIWRPREPQRPFRAPKPPAARPPERPHHETERRADDRLSRDS